MYTINKNSQHLLDCDTSINITIGPLPTKLTTEALIRALILSVLGVISLIGNITTIWNMKKLQLSRKSKWHKWSAIYFLILHLSIADLLVTIFCLFAEAAWNLIVAWVVDELSFKLIKWFQMFSVYLSIYIHVLIGIDRFIVIKYPLKSLNKFKRNVRSMIIIYICCAILSIPQVLIFSCFLEKNYFFTIIFLLNFSIMFLVMYGAHSLKNYIIVLHVNFIQLTGKRNCIPYIQWPSSLLFLWPLYQLHILQHLQQFQVNITIFFFLLLNQSFRNSNFIICFYIPTYVMH